jgi:hypothetical protein
MSGSGVGWPRAFVVRIWASYRSTGRFSGALPVVAGFCRRLDIAGIVDRACPVREVAQVFGTVGLTRVRAGLAVARGGAVPVFHHAYRGGAAEAVQVLAAMTALKARRPRAGLPAGR